MLRIDRLVDATVGHPWMSFLDIFQGYHQIPLALDDQERTTFVTPVYIDDMVVKSKVVSKYVGDLGNIFEILRKHKLCLNASKCSFGVGPSKFLGYMVTYRGIEVNLDQIKAINSLQPSQNPKEVQKFIGNTAALNRFIS